MRADRRRMADALLMVSLAAEQAVDMGLYPTTELALYEMAANQRRATTLRVDVHDLIEQHEAER
jgi:hypothetical protein